ncbi:uncharacterized protein KD926_004110 [Aspergillus affinis]|uniref:uncharacterized protein n=1 Tax=Aspergillus affinis TaxID=1070780 RepID=UPI0022FDC9F5|nr:uncharacterized protein KD926_004110 [Aspergillus affinis]KAI9046272.1 hypothetical protein KD926_004110 [Aspergillus affinis]
MSPKNDNTESPQEDLPTDEASRRPRYVPYPRMADLFSSERGLYHAVPAQTTSLESAKVDIHTLPFRSAPTRDEIPVIMEPPVNTVPSYTRECTPAFSFTSRETLPSLSPRTPPATAPFGSPEPSSGPPPYWQHIGEPTMFCTPIRELSSRTGAGHRSTVPLPSVRDLFSAGASENERNVLPPIYMSPSVYCHMRDADPASAVESEIGPRFQSECRSRSRSESPSPESGRGRAPETILSESEREKTPEEFAIPALPGPSRAAIRPQQKASELLGPQEQVPGPSAELTEFVAVDAHTAKCDLCNKRNVQGMTRCVECGWQTCNACTVKNNNFRSHRAGAVIHVGPVDKKKLPTAASVKKGKQAAKRKREDPDYVPESERASKKKRATKSQVRMTGSTSNPSSSTSSSFSSPDGSPNTAAFAGLGEDKTIINAAQALYAMSREAFEMEIWAMTSRFRKRWQYLLWVEDEDGGDDETEPLSMENLDDPGPSRPLARYKPRLRRKVLEMARGEREVYLRSQRMGQVNADALDLHEKGRSECEKDLERFNTRAQLYARKQSGR